jgi:transcriptional regulator with XRE-family HTH domain
MKKEIIETIVRIAKEKGISQHEIARRTGINYSEINAIFCQRGRNNPTILTLAKICECIEVRLTIAN